VKEVGILMRRALGLLVLATSILASANVVRAGEI